MISRQRPRAHQCHLSAQNVEQLRQFIERGFAQETTDPGDSWINAQLERFLPFGAQRGIFRQVFLQDLLGIVKPQGGLELPPACNANPSSGAIPTVPVARSTRGCRTDGCHVKNAEECLREAEECDRLVDLANTHGARTLLMVAAFQWRKLAEKAAERKKRSWPLVPEAASVAVSGGLVDCLSAVCLRLSQPQPDGR